MIIMNIQNKLYTTQSLTTRWSICSQSPSSNCRTPNSQILQILQNSPKTPNSQKRKESNSQKTRTADSFLPPRPTPIHQLSTTPTVWSISTGQPGWLSACAPAQLLPSCSSPQRRRLEKVFDFTATTENTSVTNILLILNPKHSSYLEENALYPSWNQDTPLETNPATREAS